MSNVLEHLQNTEKVVCLSEETIVLFSTISLSLYAESRYVSLPAASRGRGQGTSKDGEKIMVRALLKR
jgi:hypothetical protein